MSLARLFSILLRNVLVKQHPWFSCCASCGEIKTPLGNRLCASLAPEFPVDAVLLDGGAGAAQKLRRRAPWLRRVFAADEGGPSLPEGRAFSPSSLAAEQAVPDPERKAPPSALLHLLPDLADQYLVVRNPDLLPAEAGVPDFFTPNGIPLIHCKEDAGEVAAAFAGHGCYAQTRRNSADFLPVLTQRGVTMDDAYAAALFQWTYYCARAVLARQPRGRKRGDRARSRAGGMRAAGAEKRAPDPDSGALFSPADFASGTLPARLRQRLYALGTDLHPATSGCGPCGNYMPSLENRAFHAVQPDFPIDAVYTWVDGADPAHAAKRARYLREQRGVHENGLEQARFRDNDELRYSLRALELYAPWIRYVILVTDRQVPAWLRRDHPSVRVVDHTRFIPGRFLPTFNSHVIEAWLHAVPGLAEHYIYLNDDVFLARPCRKTDFFTPNGLPLAFMDWRKRRLFGYAYTMTPHAQSYFNTLRILRESGERTDPKCVTAHGPYPQTRSNAIEAFAFY
ncbi:MAG: Stealth CR1 domain-containing protein, partial [Desulfovibrio sp.]|nr:Stealth CR1 domain-containing protein [Desulfovibrio sp.]